MQTRPVFAQIVTFYIDKMNSLSELLSSSLLDCIPSNMPNDNSEWPNELDMLLEILSESDIQLLDRRVINDHGNDKHQQD